MQQDLLLRQNARDLYFQFEKQRRARLSFWFSITNSIAFAIFFILNSVDVVGHLQTASLGLILSDAGLGVFVGISLLGHVLSRQGRPLMAAICVVIPILVAISAFLISWIAAEQALDTRVYLALASFLILIAIAALLGNLILMFVTTLVTTSLSLFVTLVMPIVFFHFTPESYLTTAQVSNILTAVLLQWGFAMIISFALNGYQRSLQDLSETRVQFAQAKALDDLKDQFITSVNHELRNPVMAMQGYLDILEMSVENAPREKIKQLVTRAVHAGDSLRTLLTSILDARRLDQGAADFTPEQVLVRQTINDAIAMIDPLEVKGDIRDLTLQVGDIDAIWGEKVRLQQILTNLLSNALKYSSPGTPVEVSTAIVKDQEQVASRWGRAIMHERMMMEIRVRDYGLGIPTGQVPLLFQRFARLPRDLASNIIGNGLGLHLCRALTEAMGGRIWVESAGVSGEGSTFILRLPLPPESSELDLPQEEQRKELQHTELRMS